MIFLLFARNCFQLFLYYDFDMRISFGAGIENSSLERKFTAMTVLRPNYHLWEL